eukprot:1645435-Ditylum_brightwellii.AAC.1
MAFLTSVCLLFLTWFGLCTCAHIGGTHVSHGGKGSRGLQTACASNSDCDDGNLLTIDNCDPSNDCQHE